MCYVNLPRARLLRPSGGRGGKPLKYFQFMFRSLPSKRFHNSFFDSLACGSRGNPNPISTPISGQRPAKGWLVVSTGMRAEMGSYGTVRIVRRLTSTTRTHFLPPPHHLKAFLTLRMAFSLRSEMSFGSCARAFARSAEASLSTVIQRFPISVRVSRGQGVLMIQL